MFLKAQKFETGERVVEFYAAPYGWDRDGERFSERTDFLAQPGDVFYPVYYHGLKNRREKAEHVVVVGDGEFLERDAGGLKARAWLNDTPEADRIWAGAQSGRAGASSDTAEHLVRLTDEGEILFWPIATVSLFETDEVKAPANKRAVVLPLRYMREQAKAIIETGGKPVKVIGLTAYKSMKRGNAMSKRKDQEIDVEEPEDIDDPEDEEVEEEEPKKAKATVDAAAVGAMKAALKELGLSPARGKGPAAMKHARLGSGGEDADDDAFGHFIMSGNKQVAFQSGLRGKAVLEGETDAQGAVLATPKFLEKIHARLEERDLVTRLGIEVIEAAWGEDQIFAPTETTEQGDFAVNMAQADAAAAEDAMQFGGIFIRVRPYDKLVRAHRPWIRGNPAKVENFLARRFADKMASTRNKLLMVGTGAASQPRGLFEAGTVGVNFASATVIAAAEVPKLYYALQAEYRTKDVAFFMRGSTESELRQLRSTSSWDFQPQLSGGPGEVDWDTLLGRRLFAQADIPAMASLAKSIAVANLAEGFVVGAGEEGLEVDVLKERYREKNQWGYIANFRFGCALVVPEAVTIGQQAA